MFINLCIVEEFINTHILCMCMAPGDNNSNDFEVSDVENYRSDKLQVFNHQVLVMEVLRKLNDAGSHELRPGYVNTKTDREGNTTRNYIEDTRLKFIECIRTAMMVMACDYDKEAIEYIPEWLKALEVEKKKLQQAQWDWYNKLPPNPKAELSELIVEGTFNKEFGWYVKYMELEVECYRAIATELNYLTKRLDFYESEDFEA